MANVAVIGTQWGDEGKGKIVDWFSEHVDVVVRFQGGHNAGHTLVIDDEVYKLHMLPSGVMRPGKLSIIGSGVVVDPWNLVAEINAIRKQGVEITPETLAVAENAPLILSLHGELDRLREGAAAAAAKIGTTGRGIGPAYEDKVGRRAVRVADLADRATLEERVDRALAHHNPLRAGLGEPPVDRGALLAALEEIAPKVLPFSAPVWKLLDNAREEGRRILFEGAQGALLDVDFGTYPFVTSSNVIAGQAATGAGVGPGDIGFVLGIVKSYTTRVGAGPFPTELDDEDGRRLGERGREVGTTTGRARRCGWFDACLVRQACATSGVSGVAFTKLDVLDGFERIRMCVAYEIDGHRIDCLPAAADLQARCTPVYEELPGWSESTAGARSWTDLPTNAIRYVRRIEELIGKQVVLLSTSPAREDTILVTDSWEESWRNYFEKYNNTILSITSTFDTQFYSQEFDFFTKFQFNSFNSLTKSVYDNKLTKFLTNYIPYIKGNLVDDSQDYDFTNNIICSDSVSEYSLTDLCSCDFEKEILENSIYSHEAEMISVEQLPIRQQRK